MLWKGKRVRDGKGKRRSRRGRRREGGEERKKTENETLKNNQIWDALSLA